MSELDLGTQRRGKFGVFVVVALLHLLAIAALIRAFAPDLVSQTVDKVIRAVTVTVITPSPSPTVPEPAGGAGAAGKKATPRAIKAPEPKIPIARTPAPKASSTGAADRSGARDSGAGTGAGGAGSGTGSGAGGSGTGGGAARPLEKTAGEINAVRDFPAATRAQREGAAVVVEMTVGADGRARDCRVVTASGDPEADRIVCRLAEQRFRFRPRLDAAGNPVTAKYRWRQRWWNPRDGVQP
ncbi:MAG: TonB family protein [Novosphingobium sp.]